MNYKFLSRDQASRIMLGILSFYLGTGEPGKMQLILIIILPLIL